MYSDGHDMVGSEREYRFDLNCSDGYVDGKVDEGASGGFS